MSDQIDPPGEVERFVVEQIKRIGRDPSLVAETTRQAQKDIEERHYAIKAERRRLERELTGHQRKLRKLFEQPARRGDGAITA